MQLTLLLVLISPLPPQFSLPEPGPRLVVVRRLLEAAVAVEQHEVRAHVLRARGGGHRRHRLRRQLGLARVAALRGVSGKKPVTREREIWTCIGSKLVNF